MLALFGLTQLPPDVPIFFLFHLYFIYFFKYIFRLPTIQVMALIVR